MILTYIKQGAEPVGDGGDQYTGWDRFSRVIDQRWIKTSTSTALERIQYGFDQAGNRQWRKNVVASTGQDEYYTYDGLYQLKNLDRGTLTGTPPTGISGTPSWEEDFSFDPTGNWNNYVTKVNGGTTLNQNRTHNKANEILTIAGSGSLIAQNAAGNITKVPKPSDWSTAYDLTYDAWNRLVKVMSGASTVATYAYDGQNRRTTKTAAGATRHYYYSNQWQILEERLGASATADRQFVWGLRYIDDLILRDRGAERLYPLHDYFSCTAVMDTVGAVQERYGYEAFGGVRFMTAAFGSRSASLYDWETLYGAYRWDGESGFYQVRNRYSHPKLGRWLSRDPVGERSGPHLYLFVSNDPVDKVDFLGLFPNPFVPQPPPPGNIPNPPVGPFMHCSVALRCGPAFSGQDHCGLVIAIGNAVFNLDGAGGSINFRFLTPGSSNDATGPWADNPPSVCECLLASVLPWNSKNIPRDSLCANSNWNLKCAIQGCGVAIDWGDQEVPIGFDGCPECVRYEFEPRGDRDVRCCAEWREKPCPS
jgi:RHS repeat-associated protein